MLEPLHLNKLFASLTAYARIISIKVKLLLPFFQEYTDLPALIFALSGVLVLPKERHE